MAFDMQTAEPVTERDNTVTLDQFDMTTAHPIAAGEDGKTEFEVFQEKSREETQMFNSDVPSAWKTYSEVGMRALGQFAVGAAKTIGKLTGAGVEGDITTAVTKVVFQYGQLPDEQLQAGIEAHPSAAMGGGVVGGVGAAGGSGGGVV